MKESHFCMKNHQKTKQNNHKSNNILELKIFVIIGIAPVRISFAGGGTDMPEFFNEYSFYIFILEKDGIGCLIEVEKVWLVEEKITD